MSGAAIESNLISDIAHGFVLPVAIEVFDAHEGAGLHAVDIESSLEMIDFMLEDTSVPAGGVEGGGLAAVIEAVHGDDARTGDDGGESGEAEAAFEKCRLGTGMKDDFRVDDDVKRDRLALAVFENFGRSVACILRLIFDDSELKGEPDLRGGQSDAGRIVHGFAHVFDEVLNMPALDFRPVEGLGLLPEHGFPRLADF